MSKNWIDFELQNWSRWANSGPFPHPLPFGVSPASVFRRDDDDPNRPTPINIERAKTVQGVFESSAHIERKVLQAEYLSPWQYARHSGGIRVAAVRLGITERAYETILATVRRRVERVFQ